MLTPKSNSLTSCVCFLATISKALSQGRERIVFGAMSKRGQDTTSSDSSPLAKATPTNQVMHGQCKEDVSPQSSGSRFKLVNDDERKRVSPATGNWRRSDSNFEGGNNQLNRQEKVILAHRKFVQKDQVRAKNDENFSSRKRLNTRFENVEKVFNLNKSSKYIPKKLCM